MPTHWGQHASCGQGGVCPWSGIPWLGQATQVLPSHWGHEKGLGNAPPLVSREPPRALGRGGVGGAWGWGEGRWQSSQPSWIFPSQRMTPISSPGQEAGAFHRETRQRDRQTDAQTHAAFHTAPGALCAKGRSRLVLILHHLPWQVSCRTRPGDQIALVFKEKRQEERGTGWLQPHCCQTKYPQVGLLPLIVPPKLLLLKPKISQTSHKPVAKQKAVEEGAQHPR